MINFDSPHVPNSQRWLNSSKKGAFSQFGSWLNPDHSSYRGPIRIKLPNWSIVSQPQLELLLAKNRAPTYEPSFSMTFPTQYKNNIWVIPDKVFITAWWLFVIIVVTYYSGALTALILIPQIEPALNDFETMVKKSGQYDWGFLGGSDIEKYLSESTETLYRNKE